jgi:peptidoglycan L-alanyl-D-glutamate endopeptidase CwlK
MLTLKQVMNKSKNRLEGLHEIVKEAAEMLIENSYNRGVNIVITQGLRNISEQNALYAQGRTVLYSANGIKLSKVTNAKGGYSNHNFGVAIDFALLTSNGVSVSWDTNGDYDGDKKADWFEVVEEAKKLGFEWGGDWTSFVDMPHLEMTFGLSTSQYRSGKTPSEFEINKIKELIYKQKVVNEIMANFSKVFKDVDKEYQAYAVDAGADKGLFAVGNDKLFHPHDPISRGDFAVVIDRVVNYLLKNKQEV